MNNIVNSIMSILLAGNPEEALKRLIQDGGGSIVNYLTDHSQFRIYINEYLERIRGEELRIQLTKIIDDIEKNIFIEINKRNINVIVDIRQKMEVEFQTIDILPEIRSNLINSFICYIMIYIKSHDKNYFNNLNINFTLNEQINENERQNQRIQDLENWVKKIQILLSDIQHDQADALPIIKGCSSLSINNARKIVNRTKEFEIIDNIFEEGSHVAFLYGRPGIGKTTLARMYANYCSANQIYFVKYDQSIEYTVSKLSSDPKKYKVQDILTYWSNLPTSERKLILLIIDNFNEDSLQGGKKRNFTEELKTDFYNKLLDLGIRIIFTTRINTNCNIYEVPPVEEKLALFKNYCQQDTFTSDEIKLIKCIIDAVHSNTLLITLAAYIWSRSNDEDRIKLLDAIENGTLKSNSIKIPINSESELNESKDTIYNQAATLLDFSGILENSEFKKVFVNAALLPLQGISKFVFLNMMSCTDDNILNDLIDGCWILCDNNVVMMHPLIREIAFTKEIVSYALCKKYCENISKSINIEKPLIERILYKNCAYEIFSKFGNIQEMDIVLVRLFYRLSDIYDSISEKKMSMEIADVVAQNINKIDEYSLERARMLSGIAYSINNCFDSMEELEKANGLLCEANKIICSLNVDEIDRLQYALTYGKIFSNFGSNNIAKSKCNSNQKYVFLNEALKYHKKALEFRQNQAYKLLEDDNAEKIMKAEIATSYTNIATTYFLLEQYEDAIEHHKKAYELRKELENENAQSVNVQRIVGCVIETYKSNLNVSSDYINEVMNYYPDLLKINYRFKNRNNFKINLENFLKIEKIVKHDIRFCSLHGEMDKKAKAVLDWINENDDLKDTYKEIIKKIQEVKEEKV